MILATCREFLLRPGRSPARQTANPGVEWSASRPHFVYDFAPERPRNIVSTIGALGSAVFELGLPLDFPGTPGCYSALMELTDATQLARAIAWMAF